MFVKVAGGKLVGQGGGDRVINFFVIYLGGGDESAPPTPPDNK